MEKSVSSSTNSLPLFLLILLMGFPHFTDNAFSPLLPSVSAYYSVSGNMAQFVVASYFIGFAVGVFVWGVASDFIGRRKSILYALIIYCIATFACGFATSIYALFAFRMLQALGVSALGVVSQTMTRDVFPDLHKRNIIFAKAANCLALMPLIAPLFGGYVMNYTYWQVVFYIMSILGAALLLLCWYYLPETSPNLRRFEFKVLLFGLFKVFTDKKVILFSLFISGYNGIKNIFFAETPFIFMEALQIPVEYFSFMGVFLTIPWILGASWSRKLNAECERVENIISFGVVITFIGAFSMLLLTYTETINVYNPKISVFLILLTNFLVFLGFGLVAPNSVSAALHEYKDNLGISAAAFGLMYYTFIAIITSYLTYIHDGSLWPMPQYYFYIASVMLFAAIYIKYFLQK